MKTKAKIFVIVSIVASLMSIIGVTLALVYFRSEGTSVNLVVDTNLGEFINYTNGTPVLGGEGVVLNTGSDYTSGISTEIEFWKTYEAHNLDIYGHIYLDITSGSDDLLNMDALKWAVTTNDTLISEGNFVGYSEGTSVPILLNQKLLSTLTTFKVYVWIDENDFMNAVTEGEVFSVIVRCEATSGEYEGFGGEEFDYTGDIQTINLTKGTYTIEVWGASGGYATSETYRGGYGGYSSGVISLSERTTLYIAIGGVGTNSTSGTVKVYSGGFNGGGDGYVSRTYSGSSGAGGGGATHIATSSGLLSSLSSDADSILIVAGGGGGGFTDTDGKGYASVGGHGGGLEGTSITQVAGSCSSSCTSYSNPSGGTQTSGGLGVTDWSSGASSSTSYVGTFGQGATGTNTYGGGGGGFYGGASGNYVAGGGGSGYIGNTLLTNGVMYCYECTESDAESTKTISTTNVSQEAISNYAKKGNGYVRITSSATSLEVLPRIMITLGSSYDFKAMANTQVEEGLTIVYSTYDNASTLGIGEYQIKYIAEDASGKEILYYQKVEIV